MDALLMCGGAGTRLDRGEKPLFEVAGEPMVDRVLGALWDSRVDDVYAVTSPQAPETAAHVEGQVPTIETGGEGYVADLGVALERVGRPVLTVVADLPLLTGEVVDRVLDCYEEGVGGKSAAGDDSLTVCVPTALKEALGVSADATRAHGGYELSPTGLNVVGEDSEGRSEASPSEREGRSEASPSEREGRSEASPSEREGRSEASPSDNGERLHVSYDARLAVNVNRPDDAAVAEVLAGGP